jgi:photosystem II stability/assembly factor-like uncharacterized protein
MKIYYTKKLIGSLFILVLMTLPSLCSYGQRKSKPSPASNYDTLLVNGLQWRSIGPYRGGRSCTVTGVTSQPNTFYFGSVGGGVWKSTDAGQSWKNISDGYFGGSIGAVAVSESDPNVIYVGQGEKTVRGNVSSGWGVWKSTDGGKTWKFTGLRNTHHISRIRIHPQNPDIVYVAAMGDLFKSSDERGVYRSKDGGLTWQKILFANADAGAVDLIFEPGNPRILYASTWRVRRTPYSLESGGEGSSLWKSTDSGDNWTKLAPLPKADGKENGLPQSTLGIIGIAVSPVQPDRVWALVEAQDGGVFRSDDGGKTWAKTNEDRSLRQRAWYYTRIFADPKNSDQVYVTNVNFHRSKDGGKTFAEMPDTPHGDHHDLWINPNDPSRMIIADDGGAQVSTDGGESWSTYHNQPTAQFYRIITDNEFPYRIYGAQQDNSTVRIAHRTNGYSIGERDWEISAGGESGFLAVDPLNADIVYGGSYGGYLTRMNHKTGEERGIDVWPNNPMGHGAEGMKYRFQWNYPIFYSPHDPKKLYVASNHLHATTNEGQSWQTLSGDLTRNDTTKQKPSGGPITKDNTGVEYYCTIFAACESPYEKDLLWTGSDDGLIHVSRDGGKTWTNVTPPKSLLPDWTLINSVEPHPFVKGGLYVAATAYKSGDYRPYLYRTLDYGKTWAKITNGIPNEHFTRVLRADTKRQGLLYAGTEYGMYISFNDGANWQPFQLNLPIVPITDLTLKNDNLIAATQGRSFWIIDDISPLHQMTTETAQSDVFLYKPTTSYRFGPVLRSNEPPKGAGQNHPGGVTIHFYLKNKPDTSAAATLEILENSGKLIHKYASNAKEKSDKLDLKQGMNRFVWNMRYDDASKFDGLIMWSGSVRGPMAVPGMYKARLTYKGQTQEVPFEIKPDPRSKVTPAELQAQFQFLSEIRDKLTETHDAIKNIRDVRKQMTEAASRAKNEADKKEIQEAVKKIDDKLTRIEQTLYQTKNRSGQDPLNFPIRLNDKLAGVASGAASGDFAPTEQSQAVKKELTTQIDSELTKLKSVMSTDVPALNELIKSKNVPAVVIADKPVTP